MKTKIVFLDRDGTINVDTGYVCHPEQMKLIPGAAQALSSLCQKGFFLVVVSNQSGIARGYGTKETVDATNAEMQRQLMAEAPDVKIGEILYCPHGPTEECWCRKPQIGMLEALKGQYEYDPSECWMIGDKRADMEFASNVSIPPEHRLLVTTGHGEEEKGVCADVPHLELPSIIEAANLITQSL